MKSWLDYVKWRVSPKCPRSQENILLSLETIHKLQRFSAEPLVVAPDGLTAFRVPRERIVGWLHKCGRTRVS